MPDSTTTSTPRAVASVQGPPDNPYVGPRPFRQGDLFFGREREAASLVNTLLAGRVLLLHSPSGAGKTSLIQTSVVPTFQDRGFWVCAALEPEFSALRVNLPPPADAEVPNRYVFSVVNGLVGHHVDQPDALSMSLADAVALLAAKRKSSGRRLLVLDQLEEVLTLDPGDIASQTEFFRQLGEVLDRDDTWALLAMREDYMGGLDRFRRYLPGQLRATFRLDLLDAKAALRAIREPTHASGVVFEEDAAQILVDDLRKVHSGHVGDSAREVLSPHVEPVLLQVVCYSLFRKLSKSPQFSTISVADVATFRPFDKSLSKYYRGVINDVAGKANLDVQRVLRDWVGDNLISKEAMRRQTRSKPNLPDADRVLADLQARYLIRDDPRPGGTWWELSHDLLVRPIVEDNRSWRSRHSAPWQVAADAWERSGRDRELLLRGSAYRMAPLIRRDLTEVERAFLRESARANADAGRLNRLRTQRGAFAALMIASLLLNVFLLTSAWRPW